MERLSEMSLEDRDRLFADWGVPMTLRIIEQTYDPARMVTTSDISSLLLRGLVEKLPDQVTAGSGGVFLKREICVTLKNEDLPDGEVHLTQRIAYDGREYGIQKGEKSVDGGVTRLECREI